MDIIHADTHIHTQDAFVWAAASDTRSWNQFQCLREAVGKRIWDLYDNYMKATWKLCEVYVKKNQTYASQTSTERESVWETNHAVNHCDTYFSSRHGTELSGSDVASDAAQINKLILNTIQLNVNLLEKLITFQTINYCDKSFCCGQGTEVSDSHVAGDIGSLQEQGVSSRQNSFGFFSRHPPHWHGSPSRCKSSRYLFQHLLVFFNCLLWNLRSLRLHAVDRLDRARLRA